MCQACAQRSHRTRFQKQDRIPALRSQPQHQALQLARQTQVFLDLQHIIIATAMNVVRLVNWWNAPPAHPRCSQFATLAPAA
ncbi:MAG: hypothetical protein AAF329_16010 [Cyanobacteria bacterium P01_A01_bin.17]